jgi:hypothetical protein
MKRAKNSPLGIFGDKGTEFEAKAKKSRKIR